MSQPPTPPRSCRRPYLLRPGETLEQLAAERARLEAIYAEHRVDFPSGWMDYGELDPLDDVSALVRPCISCGQPPALLDLDKRLRMVCVPCHAHGAPARHRWKAVLEWNRSALAAPLDWRKAPFFGIGALSPEQAAARLKRLADHLRLRVDLEDVRWKTGEAIGQGYCQRLRAYLAWCRYIQAALPVLDHAQ